MKLGIKKTNNKPDLTTRMPLIRRSKSKILNYNNYNNNCFKKIKFDLNYSFKNTIIKKKKAKPTALEKSSKINIFMNDSNLSNILINRNKSSNKNINRKYKKISFIKNEENNFEYILSYKIIKKLGIGSFSVTYLVQDDNDNNFYALKELKSNNIDNLNEIEILKKLNHPNIIKFYKNFEFQEKQYFLLEYAGDRSLNDFLKTKSNQRLEEDEAAFFFKQLVNSISYMHKIGFAHCDLKLDNIMINKEKNKIQIIDFGFSNKIQKTSQYVGTLFYMSYDILKSRLHFNFYDDIWALGVILFKLINSVFPFNGKNKFEVLNKIKIKKINFPQTIKISKECKELISNMLALSCNKRYAANDILSSKWLNNYSF